MGRNCLDQHWTATHRGDRDPDKFKKTIVKPIFQCKFRYAGHCNKGERCTFSHQTGGPVSDEEVTSFIKAFNLNE